MAAPSPASPLDAAQLQRENDLLTNEVQRLRAELARLSGGPSAASAAPAESNAPSESAVTPQHVRAQQALEDITWLVNRLARSPIGPLLRARPGYRAMLERYGRS